MSENGNSTKWKDWTMNALMAAFIALASYIYTNDTSKHADEKKSLEAWQAVVNAEQSRQNERIAVLESQYLNTLDQLRTLNIKMDRLLERR